MTCSEAREQFSARADDALGVAARADVDAHLAGCAECRREWQRFAATVGLLRAVEPARAPAGFVDRVLAAARPQPWYRRLAHGLLVPWTIKLPLEAAAVVMVAGLAVLLFQHSPGLQTAARPPQTANELSARDQPAQRLEPPPSKEVAATPAAPPAPASRDARTPAPADSRLESERAPSAPQQADEPIVARRQQLPAPQDAPRARAVQPPAAATAPAEGVGQAHGMRQGFAREAERKTEEADTQVKKLAARVPPSVELSLAVVDRAGAQAAIATLVERLGGALVPGPGPATLEIMVPRDAFADFGAGLAQLGTLRIVRQPAELPESVRIALQLTP